ncbi:MAG: radical SAM protein [Gemmatimonadota bacterium]
MTAELDHRELYRLPWSLTDNSISWLEPTAACNLYCLGCYRSNDPKGHKPLAEIARDLDVFTRLRISDGVSVAGGDPLTHPQVPDIIALVAERGFKPILNTNGLALTPELLTELKAAGLMGLTIHIDSKQRRPHWRDKTETELNELRLHYARMIDEIGDLACSFNATVYEDTLDSVPDIVEWGQKHIDIVNTLVFITYRAGIVGGHVDYYAGDQKVDFSPVPYAYGGDEAGKVDILSTDVVGVIRRRYPQFQPCAYLNGTEKPESLKWLLTTRIGTKRKIYGYAGPRFMELMQAGHHFVRGRYLAYARPKSLRRGRAALFFLSPLDRGVGRAASNFARAAVRNPLRALGRVHLQSVMIIQPADLLEDGRLSMCDGCPDMTVWKDELAWSCRLDEQMRFGANIRTVLKTNGHSDARNEVAVPQA